MALSEGEYIGSYRIIEPIGQGGMATVYKAYHPLLNRHVAIKMMHQALLEDTDFLARFRREAQIIANLEHPNIVPVYDYSEHQGQPYLVMKYIEGLTLKQEIASSDLSFEQIISILAAVADGLTYAHQRGVLHRDVKPSNIILDADQRPYLTDFGLARLAQSGQSTLSQDMLIGTPHYISPEQARGNSELGPGTDIYALGVILYEVAVGRVPFSGNTPYAIVHDHIYTPLPLPTEVNPDVPPPVEAILLRALAKEPADRYPSAVELLAAFHNAIQQTGFKTGKSAQPGSHTSAPRLTKPPVRTIAIPADANARRPKAAPARAQPSTRKKRPWLPLVGAAVVFILIAVFALVVKTRRPADDTPLPTLAAPGAAALEYYDVPELSLEDARAAVQATPNDPSSYLALARALWQNNQSSDAYAAIQAGYAHAGSGVTYLLTAAALADEQGLDNAAIVLNDAALAQAAPGDQFTAVRAFVGEYMYQAALEQRRINIVEIRRIYNETEVQPSNLLELMAVRLLITQDRPALAEGAMRRLVSDSEFSAESYLIEGELRLALGSRQRAVEAWQQAIDTPDAPDWVRARAAELNQSNSGA